MPNYKYWNKYGPFGIEMNPKWVVNNDFRKVIYTKQKGIKFSIFKRNFESALSELDRVVYAEYPDDASRHMAYTNKNVAGDLGARKWVEFLTIFEYMEPHKNSFEREWRFVRKEPLYNNDSIPIIVDNLNNDRGWSKHIYPLKFESSDAVRIHAEKHSKAYIRKRLPAEYSGIEINTTLNKAFQRIQSLTRLFR